VSSIVQPRNCTLAGTGIVAVLCQVKVAVLTLASPIAWLVLVYVLRTRISGAVRAGIARLPAEARFLVPAGVARGLFTMTWAQAHRDPLAWASCRGSCSPR